MSHSYETECPSCHSKVKVIERPMGVPGGKEKEQGYCPKCNGLVAEFMTDGFINVELVQTEK
jgi:Zn finger protein HypA/HybF involved in hydrogenase expression